MSASPLSTPPAPASDTATVELAEAAWLEAMNTGDPDAWRRLMHPECVVVHAPVGHIQNVDEFLQFRAGASGFNGTKTYDVTVQRFGEVAIVTSVIEFHATALPGAAPFPIQAATTRVWVLDGADWKLAHLQLQRRQLPG